MKFNLRRVGILSLCFYLSGSVYTAALRIKPNLNIVRNVRVRDNRQRASYGIINTAINTIINIVCWVRSPVS